MTKKKYVSKFLKFFKKIETKNNYSLFHNGVFDTLPLVFAAVPFGIIFGALSVSIGLSPLVTISMSLFVFAGSSQFIAISLLSTSASMPVVLLAVFFVNLRHLLYSVNLMPKVSSISQKYRIPMAFWLTDETFAVVSKFVKKNRDDTSLLIYYFGSSISMYFSWTTCTFIGIFLGEKIPNITNWGLDVAMILAFIGIVVPQIKARSDLACALIAMFSTLFTYHWPNQIGLIFSSLLGICAGHIIKNLNIGLEKNE